MGNHRFRLSDMMPNAWFYKLKDMGRTKNHIRNKKKQQQTDPSNSNQPHSYPRKSYYFSRELVSHDKFCNSPKSIDPPRKSSKRIRSRKLSTAAAAARTSPKTVSSPVSAGCNCRANLWTKPESPRQSCSSEGKNGSLEIEDEVPNFPPEFRTDRILTTDSFDDMVAWSRSESDAKDIVIDVKRIELPPIITKSEKFDDSVKDLKKSPKHHRNSQISANEQRNSTSTARKSTSSSPRVKLRIHSPKIANRKITQGRKSGSGSRRSLSESLAVVKSSANPQKDFRDSMVEMIVQNNLRASKDLEDLLACYLTLNSDEYHEIIIKVFKQIWFDFSDHVRPD